MTKSEQLPEYKEPRDVSMLRSFLRTKDFEKTAREFKVSAQTVMTAFGDHLAYKREIMALAKLEVMDWPNKYSEGAERIEPKEPKRKAAAKPEPIKPPQPIIDRRKPKVLQQEKPQGINFGYGHNSFLNDDKPNKNSDYYLDRKSI